MGDLPDRQAVQTVATNLRRGINQRPRGRSRSVCVSSAVPEHARRRQGSADPTPGRRPGARGTRLAQVDGATRADRSARRRGRHRHAASPVRRLVGRRRRGARRRRRVGWCRRVRMRRVRGHVAGRPAARPRPGVRRRTGSGRRAGVGRGWCGRDRPRINRQRAAALRRAVVAGRPVDRRAVHLEPAVAAIVVVVVATVMAARHLGR